MATCRSETSPYDLVNICTASLTDLCKPFSVSENVDGCYTDVVKQSLAAEAGLGSFKEFWQVASSALNDWAKTTRMCVLVTVINLNLTVAHWLPQWPLH